MVAHLILSATPITVPELVAFHLTTAVDHRANSYILSKMLLVERIIYGLQIEVLDRVLAAMRKIKSSLNFTVFLSTQQTLHAMAVAFKRERRAWVVIVIAVRAHRVHLQMLVFFIAWEIELCSVEVRWEVFVALEVNIGVIEWQGLVRGKRVRCIQLYVAQVSLLAGMVLLSGQGVVVVPRL